MSAMTHYRDFDIECTIIPDAAGQYEAAFVIEGAKLEHAGKKHHADRIEFPPVGSYLTPEDAREQTLHWAHRWIDANY
jgi:hypothetical protein